MTAPRRIRIADAPVEDLGASGLDYDRVRERDGLLLVNLGPSHPATHGCLRILCALSGETIEAAVAEMGYLHRGFEKDCETHPWQQNIPYTDRLNYVSAMMNNVGFCKAVERLMAVEVPERAVFLRVIVSELNRIIDHLVCAGTNLVDLGALTNFWWAFNARERVYDVLERLCGARLTHSYTRIGGLARDAYPGFEDEVRSALKAVEGAVSDVEALILTNRIFLDRTRGVCRVSREDAVAWGWTGPTLRASGAPRDLRKDEPYYHYDEFRFEVPVGTAGDTYDRIVIRFHEIRESAKIVRQALDRLPSGPVMTSDKRAALPPKQAVYGHIEGLMNHFKIVMHGVQPPPGEVYDATEAANGELGFTLVSDGGRHPYRVKCRPPCFMNYAAFPSMIEGSMVADAVATLGSINVVAGELDR
jgi:NADH dehydrogenase I D subunit